MGADPGSYRDYLEAVIDQTARHRADPRQRVVFSKPGMNGAKARVSNPTGGSAIARRPRWPLCLSSLDNGAMPELDRIPIVIHVYQTDLLS